MTEPSRVLVAVQQPIARRGLALLLEGQPWVRQVIEVGDAAAARKVATLDAPAAAMIDLGGAADSVDLLRELRGIRPDCAYLVLVGQTSPAGQAAVVGAGGRGYLGRDLDPDLVIDAVRLVLRGGLVLSHSGDATPEPMPLPAPLAGLSPRDLRLAMLVGQGLDNQQIATRVGLSEKTVRNLISAVLVATGVRDRVNLALLVRSSLPDDH